MADKSKPVKTSLQVPGELYWGMKEAALMRQISETEAIRRAMALWIKEGGPEPGIVAAAPKPEPLPSVQVLRASRTLLTVLQNYVKVLELSLNRSQFSDIHTSTGDEVLDLARARVLLAELGAMLGGSVDETGKDGASATFDAARTFADRTAVHGRDEEDRGASAARARRGPKKK